MEKSEQHRGRAFRLNRAARFCALAVLVALACRAQIQEPLATFSGEVQEISPKIINLLDAGGNTLQFVCTHKTRYFDGAKKIKASEIRRGNRVSIETKRFPDGELEAINVRLERRN